MKALFILYCTLLFSAVVWGQKDTSRMNADTTAPYLKTPFMPAFSIQTQDSSWFNKASLETKRPTLILYFSPDCGHCQTETEEIISKMKELKNLQIIMITSRPFEDMTAFADKYKINRFPSIKIGTDPARLVTRFYDVRFTPFSALYDKKGKLVKVYKDGLNMQELITLAN
jgi:thiol-disulfide isomerase/thioredoxin